MTIEENTIWHHTMQKVSWYQGTQNWEDYSTIVHGSFASPI
jgi:hypothetical protein